MKPLAGIRVADFTVHNAGPFCTNLLSQLGAEIVKVESAMRPDAFRKPHPVYGRLGAATFDQVASGKLSVRLNLKQPKGVALASPPDAPLDPPAPHAELEALIQHFVRDLDTAGYFFPEDRTEATLRTLRTMLTKTGWSHNDIRMMHGIVTALGRTPRSR
jgi:tRNA/rRNA methyltransferase